MTAADIRALREEIERLQSRVDELSEQAVERADLAPAAVADASQMPRRGLLRTVGAAAAGAAVGSLAFARPAAAADGGNIIIGSTNTADSSTLLVTNSGYSASPAVGAFHVTDSGGSTNLNMSFSCISAIASGARQSVAFVGSGSSVGAKFDGPIPLKLTDSTSSAAPTTASGTAGQFKVVSGDLWFCSQTANSNDAIWRRLSGTTVAGGFVALDPVRAYDSRLGAYTPNGVLAPNTSRVISIKDAHNASGGVSVANVVPAGATAVTFNLTVTGTTDANFVAVTPGSATSFTASTLNWSTVGASVANGGVCKLDASRQLKVFMGDQPGSAHIILDITGYYL